LNSGKDCGLSLNGPEEETLHTLHDKQYTPDLKQSDFRLQNSNRQSVTAAPYEKSAELKKGDAISMQQQSQGSGEVKQTGKATTQVRQHLNGFYRKQKKKIISQNRQDTQQNQLSTEG